jgi:hypothetical protein
MAPGVPALRAASHRSSATARRGGHRRPRDAGRRRLTRARETDIVEVVASEILAAWMVRLQHHDHFGGGSSGGNWRLWRRGVGGMGGGGLGDRANVSQWARHSGGVGPRQRGVRTCDNDQTDPLKVKPSNRRFLQRARRRMKLAAAPDARACSPAIPQRTTRRAPPPRAARAPHAHSPAAGPRPLRAAR